MTRFLVVLDVDSTLIKDEVIELIAAHAGIEEKVRLITEAAMRGEIDFETSLRERVALLAGVSTGVLDQVRGRIRLTEGASDLIAAVHEHGGKIAAVSGGFAEVLEPLAAELKLDYWRANRLETKTGQMGQELSGEVLGAVVTAAVKEQSLREWAELSGLAVSKTIAVGDGANDLMMLSAAGLGVAFNAKPKVRQAADLVVAGDSLAELIALLPS